jgi:hypothetical protein
VRNRPARASNAQSANPHISIHASNDRAYRVPAQAQAGCV